MTSAFPTTFSMSPMDVSISTFRYMNHVPTQKFPLHFCKRMTMQSSLICLHTTSPTLRGSHPMPHWMHFTNLPYISPPNHARTSDKACYSDTSAYTNIRVSCAVSMITLVVSALNYKPGSIQVRFVKFCTDLASRCSDCVFAFTFTFAYMCVVVSCNLCTADAYLRNINFIC